TISMFQPDELRGDQPLVWSAGTGKEVWDLFGACVDGNLETVQRMIEQNPSLVRSHYEYRTPLYFAVRENRIDVARFLLDHGANPFYNGEDLIEMTRIRALKEMEALIESRRCNAKSTVRSASDIWSAASSGDTERVRQFLDEVPSLINQRGGDRPGTALVHAA